MAKKKLQAERYLVIEVDQQLDYGDGNVYLADSEVDAVQKHAEATDPDADFQVYAISLSALKNHVYTISAPKNTYNVSKG